MCQQSYPNDCETCPANVCVADPSEAPGKLYGVAIGGLFAGESMFHRVRDASKVALVALVELLGDDTDRLLDTQWSTEHLATLGVVEIARAEYVRRLRRALELPSTALVRQYRARARGKITQADLDKLKK